MKKLAVNIARLILAVAFILSGFVKAVDPLGTQYKIQDYLVAMGLGRLIPDFMTLSASVLLSTIEFILGICLLFAIRRRMVSKIVLVLMAAMTLLTLWLALTDPISDCGCFGDALVLTNWQTFWKNIVLLTAAVIVWRYPLLMPRLIGETNQWIVMNYSGVFILLVIAGRSLYTLPQFDFRPYHVGTNLRQGWQRMMEGEDSPYAEFFMELTDEGEDITEDVLSDPSYTFLLISPHLENANDSDFGNIDQIYEYSQDNGYNFYCLTASGEGGIERWRELTGAEYPFCTTDATTLKTIIRSNPGLLLLHNGVVIRKWSHHFLPDATQLTGRLEDIETGQMPPDATAAKIIKILLWFALPLFALALADRLWAWTRLLKRRK